MQSLRWAMCQKIQAPITQTYHIETFNENFDLRSMRFDMRSTSQKPPEAPWPWSSGTTPRQPGSCLRSANGSCTQAWQRTTSDWERSLMGWNSIQKLQGMAARFRIWLEQSPNFDVMSAEWWSTFWHLTDSVLNLTELLHRNAFQVAVIRRQVHDANWLGWQRNLFEQPLQDGSWKFGASQVLSTFLVFRERPVSEGKAQSSGNWVWCIIGSRGNLCTWAIENETSMIHEHVCNSISDSLFIYWLSEDLWSICVPCLDSAVCGKESRSVGTTYLDSGKNGIKARGALP